MAFSLRRVHPSRMKTWHWIIGLVALPLSNISYGACCYFSAKDKDVNQPAQKAFITWDPAKKAETFTVQPKFEGDAEDFGMVIPTPTQPKLSEMPRTFFKSLAVFTILEPMDTDKYQPQRFLFAPRAAKSAAVDRKPSVRIVESGVVGSLDYKIIDTDRADDFYDWLKAHEYQFAGDEATLDHYIKKGWFFTVMKIDPKQMKRRADGTYSGDAVCVFVVGARLSAEDYSAFSQRIHRSAPLHPDSA